MDVEESSRFLFVKSKSLSEERRTGRGGGGVYVPYESSEYETSWSEKPIDEQMSSTISAYNEKSLKDENDIFFVLGLSKQHSLNERGEMRDKFTIFTSDYDTIINHLSGEVLEYLNEEHTKVLVKCPFINFKKFLSDERYLNKYFQTVIRIGPLLRNERLSYDLLTDNKWSDEKKAAIVQIMPNLEAEKNREYISKITDFLEKQKIISDTSNDNGVLYVELKKNEADNLLDSIDFIYRIESTPTAYLENMHTLDNFLSTKKTETSLLDKIPQDEFPEICLLDSGINEIPPLLGLITELNGHYRFFEFDDGVEPYGHGTPIACLASLSESLQSPAAKIISYKIYSDDHTKFALRGLRNGITRYSERTRLFLSSIVFEDYNPVATTLLDRQIQNANICFIMSAGNICKTSLFNEIASGNSYPLYNKQYFVSDPAQAHSILSVGAISKENSQDTIAAINQVAPFSRCGHNYPSLHQCVKPEVSQNGGNVCLDGTNFGCLTSYDKDGIKQDVFIGTSFAAPLVMRRIVEIEYLYGNKIVNAETLKAIAIASTARIERYCTGFGETHYHSQSHRKEAVLICEGSLVLPYTTRPFYKKDNFAEIVIDIPDSVKTIEMITVHTDNGSRSSEPSLNTYLTIRAKKQGRPSSYVNSVNKSDNNKKSHIKCLRWEFKRKSIEGKWTFIIRPDVTAEMLEEHKREITIRYGCVFILTTKQDYKGVSLTSDMINLMGDEIS